MWRSALWVRTAKLCGVGAAILATVVGASLSGASCQGLPEGTSCDEIPSGGCPTDRGGSCDDPTCAAVYNCNNGAWSLFEECPASEGGVGGGYVVSPDGGGVLPLCSSEPIDGGCPMVTLDLSGQTTDCTPDLMFPDCPAVAAQGCAACACLTGCEDFYLCTEPGWVSVAYCDDEENLIASRQ
jgi:hypothetical protein